MKPSSAEDTSSSISNYWISINASDENSSDTRMYNPSSKSDIEQIILVKTSRKPS